MMGGVSVGGVLVSTGDDARGRSCAKERWIESAGRGRVVEKSAPSAPTGVHEICSYYARTRAQNAADVCTSEIKVNIEGR